MIVGIHHIAMHTGQFDQMLDFYKRAFGFKPVSQPLAWSGSPEIDQAIGVENSTARTVMLKAGTCYLELFEYANPPARKASPLRPNDHGYTHFCVDVTDLDSVYGDLVAAGMTFGGNRPIDQDGIKAVYGYDPDGNVIEIQQLAADHPFGLSQLEKTTGNA
jgi:glyoxylase I family protein